VRVRVRDARARCARACAVRVRVRVRDARARCACAVRGARCALRVARCAVRVAKRDEATVNAAPDSQIEAALHASEHRSLGDDAAADAWLALAVDGDVDPSERAETKEVTDPSPRSFDLGTPTRSETQLVGAKERPVMRSVALDLAKKDIAFCEVRSGKVVARGTAADVHALERLLGPHTAKARVAIEACREAWFVADLLRGWGHEPVLVDTTRVKQLGIGAHGRKTDRIDAEVLARALDKNAIPQAHELSHERQELRITLVVRNTLVQSRADLVVQARGVARSFGVPLPSCNAENFARTLDGMVIPQPIAVHVAALRAAITTLDAQIDAVDARLVEMCRRDPTVALLMTAPCVGVIVAAAFVSVVDDSSDGASESRFDSAHTLESYLGLVPSEDTTGGRRRLGQITKRGNRYLRAMLVEAAWGILRSKTTKDPLVAWGKSLAARTKPKIAAVAVARKLAGVLWAMWRRRRPYDANWQTKTRKELEPTIDQHDEAAARARVEKKFARHTRPRTKKEVSAAV